MEMFILGRFDIKTARSPNKNSRRNANICTYQPRKHRRNNEIGFLEICREPEFFIYLLENRLN